MATVDNLDQRFLFAQGDVKGAYLVHLLDTFTRDKPKSSIMIFVKTCKYCQVLAIVLKRFRFVVVVVIDVFAVVVFCLLVLSLVMLLFLILVVLFLFLPASLFCCWCFGCCFLFLSISLSNKGFRFAQ